MVPAQFRVVVTRRPKYADHLPLCRHASEALKHIVAFYAIEKEIRGRSAEASPHAAAEELTIGRCLRDMAARQAGSHQPRSSSPRPSATPFASKA
ncbi:hypothetical protein ACVMB0_000055 [Bradyrhizobium sp. USDA 4451]